jgi:hypothetical protein
LSPVNEGEERLPVRSFTERSKIAMGTDLLRREAIARMSTDLAYRAWHDENYGAVYAELHAQEALARAEFGIEVLSERPMDRLWEKFRHG